MRRTTRCPASAAPDQERVDLDLAHEMVGALLAGEDPLGVGPGEVEDAGHDQPVVDDDVGGAQQAGRLQREELGIARPRPHEPDHAAAAHVQARHDAEEEGDLAHLLNRAQRVAGAAAKTAAEPYRNGDAGNGEGARAGERGPSRKEQEAERERQQASDDHAVPCRPTGSGRQTLRSRHSASSMTTGMSRARGRTRGDKRACASQGSAR